MTNYYEVKKGDTLTSIANEFGLSASDIESQNKEKLTYSGGLFGSSTKLVVGMILTIETEEPYINEEERLKNDQEMADAAAKAAIANGKEPPITNLPPSIPEKPKSDKFKFNANDLSNILTRRSMNTQVEYDKYYDRKLDSILRIKFSTDIDVDKYSLEEEKVNIFTDFNRYSVLNGVPDYYENGYGYLFITTPNLNIGGGTGSNRNLEADSFLYNLNKREPHIVKSLTNGLDYGSSPIIKILSNSMITFETRDLSMKTITTHETFEGYKTLMPTSFVESMSGDQFSISYRESPDLEIMKLHKCWLDYIFNLRRGKFVPDATTLSRGELDFMSAAYFFATKPDGRTITYFAKYTGVAPTSIPYSTLSFKKGDHSSDLEFPYSYSYMYKEDLNPDIILDFKSLFTNSSKSDGIDIIQAIPSVQRAYGTPKFDYQIIFNNEDYTGNMVRVNSKGAADIGR